MSSAQKRPRLAPESASSSPMPASACPATMSGSRRVQVRSLVGDCSFPPTSSKQFALSTASPHWGAELTTNTLPPEAGPHMLRAISYTKGCYVGQETIARLKSVGHVNKTLVFLQSGSALNFPATGTPKLILRAIPKSSGTDHQCRLFAAPGQGNRALAYAQVKASESGTISDKPMGWTRPISTPLVFPQLIPNEITHRFSLAPRFYLSAAITIKPGQIQAQAEAGNAAVAAGRFRCDRRSGLWSIPGGHFISLNLIDQSSKSARRWFLLPPTQLAPHRRQLLQRPKQPLTKSSRLKRPATTPPAAIALLLNPSRRCSLGRSAAPQLRLSPPSHRTDGSQDRPPRQPADDSTSAGTNRRF